MTCSQCLGLEKVFDEKYVSKESNDYHRKGPPKTTRWLIEALKEAGVQGLTLLDIGGGVGAIQHALLEAGVTHVTGVEASTAYIRAAHAEAERRGQASQITLKQGNFIDLSADVSPADIVTLDRVICCYNDMELLVGASTSRSLKYYGVVYPRDGWWMKAAIGFGNFFMRLMNNPYQAYVHPTEKVEAIVKGKGFSRRYYRQTLAWQVAVYAQ